MFLFHFFYRTDFHGVCVSNGNIAAQSVFRWLMQICVPLFFMSTGFLQANKGFSRRYYRNTLRFVITYFVISLITVEARAVWLDPLNGIYHGGDGDFLLDYFIGLFTFTTIDYGWFVYAFIALYLGIPVLNLVWTKLKKDKYRYLFVAGIALFMWLNFFGITMHLYPVLYYYLGKIFRKRRSKKIALPCGLVAAIILALETLIYAFIINNGLTQWVRYIDNYGSILPVCLATCVFLMLLNCECKRPLLNNCVKSAAQSTYEIYLFAFIFDFTFYPLALKLFPLPSQEAVFALFPTVPLISFICAFAAASLYRFVRAKIS